MLRNKELKRFVILFFITAFIAITSGFSIDWRAGILCSISSAVFGSLFFIFTRARYQNIARISEQIDLVLHNTDHLFIAESEEGELSILQSEITKMTMRIREQNLALKKEKKHLADSLADIAHQLRTPLTSANLILSLLENNSDRNYVADSQSSSDYTACIDCSNEKKELLREIKELFSQMEWLLASLLKLSRLDAGVVVFQRSEINADILIKTAVRPLLLSMELHNITLYKKIPDTVLIYGDLGWLSEALQNILKNCMESAGDNGKIEIICEDNPLFTEIIIHDSGAGIPKEDLPFLFDRFYRGKNSEAVGYGIGLALCKTIIMRQNGTISVKNHPAQGAVFSIRFPK